MEVNELFKEAVQITVSIIFLIVMWLKLKSIFKWKKGDTFKDFFIRSTEAHEKSVEQTKNLFGSVKNTWIATLTIFAFLWIMTIVTRPDSPSFMRYVLLIYMVIGFFMSKEIYNKYKNEELTFNNKVFIRFYFIATWPIHIEKK